MVRIELVCSAVVLPCYEYIFITYKGFGLPNSEGSVLDHSFMNTKNNEKNVFHEERLKGLTSVPEPNN